jgi:hypothetical protein
MRWEWPVEWGWRRLLAATAGLAVVLFLQAWAGYSNGPIHYVWGDPVPFAQVLAQLPRFFAGAFLVVVVCVALAGLRSGSNKP